MLTHAVTKAFIPTIKPDESKLFYKDTLGLKFLSQDDYGFEFNANGTLLRVIIVPELKPQIFTVLGWNVKDIVSTIKTLNKKYIFCEKYSFLQQDILGIWISPNGSKVAWFKDPDENVLSLTE